jgi:hypothetical protein
MSVGVQINHQVRNAGIAIALSDEILPAFAGGKGYCFDQSRLLK